MTIEEVQNTICKDNSLYAYIKSIREADFGCEERLPGQELTCLVELITANEEIIKELPDRWLTTNNLEEGSFITNSLSKVVEES